jgi:hypothetical protein
MLYRQCNLDGLWMRPMTPSVTHWTLPCPTAHSVHSTRYAWFIFSYFILMYHLILYTVIHFCVEDPQECSTAGVYLQLHRSHWCGSSHSTTGSRSRCFIGCRPLGKRTCTNSDAIGQQWGHQRGCVPQHGHVLDSARNELRRTKQNFLSFQHFIILAALSCHDTLVGRGWEFSVIGCSACDPADTTSTPMIAEGPLHPEW